MGTFAIISLIFSVLMTVGSTMAGVFTNMGNQQQARRNEELARETREDQQQFAAEQQQNANRTTYEMFNLLDSPQAKVQQLKQAGLSPGLIYGGSGGMGGSHSSAMAGTPSAQAGVNAPFLNPILSMFADPTESLKTAREGEKAGKEKQKVEEETENIIEQRKQITEATNQIKANIKKIEEETNTEVLTQQGIKYDNEMKQLELEYQQATLNDRCAIVERQAQLIQATLDETLAKIEGLNIENANKQDMINLAKREANARIANLYQQNKLLAEQVITEVKKQNVLIEQATTEYEKQLLMQAEEDKLGKESEMLDKMMREKDWEYSNRYWEFARSWVTGLAQVGAAAAAAAK